ncbi:sodium- and chloride-dependent glycine transporter 1 [Aplysia californica]|uniref:Transporter n=1 Tax=Aplysia californica TaxID=6500 RepID=A0ABM0JGN6_APLCA|nr:sodium- and chloride-dependent glycine transporter 1 [Aplysia californica]
MTKSSFSPHQNLDAPRHGYEPSDEQEKMVMMQDKVSGLNLPTEKEGEMRSNALYNGASGEEVFITCPLNSSLEGGEEEMEAQHEARHKWGRKTEYVLSMVGFCVGLGNVWRFPYVCIRNGGGAFLIPFFICLTLCGLPLYLLEVSMGQFVSLSPYHVWSICPLFKGIGISMNVLCFLCSWYYSMILAWSLIFLVNCFRDPLPWTVCGQWWNSPKCITRHNVSSASADNNSNNSSYSFGLNSTASTLFIENGTFFNSSVNSTTDTTEKFVGASEEFWIRNVLQLSDGLHDVGSLPWQSGVALFVSSVIVFLCIVKGIHSSGKVVYVTATLPYLLLVVLLIKGATLPGAMDGVIFYLKPDFSKLGNLQTWVEASVQVFYSLGPVWGGLITMASYNKFNNNCLRDAVILSFVCEGTSVFAGFAIFTILGHMAHNLKVPVANFSDTGPGLAFVVYPEAISYLPVPQLWGVLFFVMLFTLGLDTQFVMCETILTTIGDLWPQFVGKSKVIFKVVFLFILFLISLPYATEGGMYLFQLVDWYFASFAMVLDGLLELVVVNWIYGSSRFLDDIKMMIGYRPPYLFVVFWRFITPAILLTVFVSTLMSYGPPVYHGYHYDSVGIGLGKFIACVPLIPIPAYAAYLFIKTPGTFIQRLKTTLSPSSQWQPADKRLRSGKN